MQLPASRRKAALVSNRDEPLMKPNGAGTVSQIIRHTSRLLNNAISMPQTQVAGHLVASSGAVDKPTDVPVTHLLPFYSLNILRIHGRVHSCLLISYCLLEHTIETDREVEKTTKPCRSLSKPIIHLVSALLFVRHFFNTHVSFGRM